MAAGTSGGRIFPVALPRFDLRLLVGAGLAVVAIAGGMSYAQQARVTAPVVVAAREIPAGDVIEADDLTVGQARLEGAAAPLVIPAAELDSLIGLTASGDIHAGELVVRPDVGDGPVLGPDDVAVTVPVAADAVYPWLRRGDAVAVLGTSDRGRPQSQTVTVIERAIVYDVALEPTRVTLGADDDEDGRPTNVTLIVPREDAERLAHALVNWDLTLALLARESNASGDASP